MLQYGWYFDNSKDFSGMKIWKLSIYVHLCCSMGEILIIQTNQKTIFQNWKNILCTPLGYSMYTFFFNSWRCPKTYFFQFYILCTSSFLYICMFWEELSRITSQYQPMGCVAVWFGIQMRFRIVLISGSQSSNHFFCITTLCCKSLLAYFLTNSLSRNMKSGAVKTLQAKPRPTSNPNWGPSPLLGAIPHGPGTSMESFELLALRGLF